MIKEIYGQNIFKIKKSNLKFAVIGHIEWIAFMRVDSFPIPGSISHATRSLEKPAGAGSLIAKTLNELTNNDVHFFTSLGYDYYGKLSYKILKEMGLKLHVAWRNLPTRKGFSLIGKEGERSITIMGKRLEPKFSDKLDWKILDQVDGIFITAGDKEIFKYARAADILCTTPRVGLNIINNSKIKLDGLIGSNLDPGELYSLNDLDIKPRFIIKTEGSNGGIVIPGGRYKAINNQKTEIDSYGCGDSFAAGIIYGLSSKWSIEKSITLGKVLGRNCVENFGPYPNIQNILC